MFISSSLYIFSRRSFCSSELKSLFSFLAFVSIFLRSSANTFCSSRNSVTLFSLAIFFKFNSCLTYLLVYRNFQRVGAFPPRVAFLFQLLIALPRAFSWPHPSLLCIQKYLNKQRHILGIYRITCRMI